MFVAIILIICIFTGHFYSSSIIADNPRSKFDLIPEDVLRIISEYCDNPFTLRSLNKAFNRSIPSAQTVISAKFDARILSRLPSTPELWHLLRFKGALNDLLLESCRHLPKSQKLMTEAVALNTICGSIGLTVSELEQLVTLLNDHHLTELFVALQSKFLAFPFKINSPQLLISAAKSITLSKAQSLDLANEHSLKLYLVSLFMSPLSTEEQVAHLQNVVLMQNVLITSLLEAITHVEFRIGHFEKYTNLIKGLSQLRRKHSKLLFHKLIQLRFNSFSIDSDEFSRSISLFKAAYARFAWHEYFLLAAIEVYRLDVIRMLFAYMIETNLKVSNEVKEALFDRPEILANIQKDTLVKVLGENYIEFRTLFHDLNVDSTDAVTLQDVLVSAYIQTSEQFTHVLAQFHPKNHAEWSVLLSKFLKDSRLLHNLQVISENLKTLPKHYGLDFHEISFDVLKFVILNYEHLNGIFENQHPTLSYYIETSDLIDLLRDHEVYAVLKNNPFRIFRRLFCSFVGSVQLFTKYDWILLLNLSHVALTFTSNPSNNNQNRIKNALQPWSFTPLSRTLDLIKSNMIDFISYMSAGNFQSNSDYTPLLELWEDTDPKGYNNHFSKVDK